MAMSNEAAENKPNQALHLLVWVAALAGSGVVRQSFGWWAAVAVFVSVMIVWGLILEARGQTSSFREGKQS